MDYVHIRISRSVAEALRDMTGAGSVSEAVELALEPLSDAVLDSLTDPDYIKARIVLLRVMAKTLKARARELERQAETLEAELAGFEREDVTQLFRRLNLIIVECSYDEQCILNRARPLIEEIEEKVHMPRGWLSDQIELVRKTTP